MEQDPNKQDGDEHVGQEPSLAPEPPEPDFGEPKAEEDPGYQVGSAFFKRMDDGAVRIRVMDGDDTRGEVTVSAADWAHIIGTVSKHGRGGQRFQQAIDFHNA